MQAAKTQREENFNKKEEVEDKPPVFDMDNRDYIRRDDAGAKEFQIARKEATVAKSDRVFIAIDGQKSAIEKKFERIQMNGGSNEVMMRGPSWRKQSMAEQI